MLSLVHAAGIARTRHDILNAAVQVSWKEADDVRGGRQKTGNQHT
jgi:hypothetical protein